jgi:cell division ATPase FtsA
MAFHLSHIQDYNRFIAIDIWSYRVRAAVYDISSWKAEELSYATIRQDRKNIINGAIADLRSVALTLERAIIQATKDLDTIPDDVILSFSSRMTLSDIITTQYIRENKNSAITMEEIDEIIKRIEAESFDRIREKARREYAIWHDDIRLISSTITAITIDGKAYTNPLGSSGANIRLTILNIFTPASEYNIIRSVVASLWKKAISLIPTPLVFAKIIEKSDYMSRNTCILDVWFHHTTLILENKNEIIGFETFSFWVYDLVHAVSSEFPDYSPLQIEKMLHNFDTESPIKEHMDDFLSYLVTTAKSYIKRTNKWHVFSQMFLHGGIFDNDYIQKNFFEAFKKEYHHPMTLLEKNEILPMLREDGESAIPYWLSVMAHELLLIKKDPLVRILRYVLYNYE